MKFPTLGFTFARIELPGLVGRCCCCESSSFQEVGDVGDRLVLYNVIASSRACVFVYACVYVCMGMIEAVTRQGQEVTKLKKKTKLKVLKCGFIMQLITFNYLNLFVA